MAKVHKIAIASVSKTLEYIKGQREHHKRVSFADEYKAFLISYNIEYDERYVFKD